MQLDISDTQEKFLLLLHNPKLYVKKTSFAAKYFLKANDYSLLQEQLCQSLQVFLCTVKKCLRSVNTDILFVVAVSQGLAKVICYCRYNENAQSENLSLLTDMSH